VLTSALSRSFRRTGQDKVPKTMVSPGGRLRQTMVDSWYYPDRVIPDGMSQIWRRSEVRNHKRHTLNTRLSSGTSEHTSSSSQNVPGRMIQSDLFWNRNTIITKPAHRDTNLPDQYFGGFRSTLNSCKLGVFRFECFLLLLLRLLLDKHS
jgi:hypothetical protein